MDMELEKLDYAPPFKGHEKLLALENTHLMGAGPTNCTDRTLRALSLQGISPISKQLFQIVEEVKEMAKYVFQTRNPLTVAIQATGNGGNEAILFNLLEPGETVVIAVGGFWGDLVVEMASRQDINVVPLRKAPGEVFSLEELENVIIEKKPALVFMTHGESTGGILQPLEGIGRMCHKHNCLLGIDAVASLVAVPLFVDRWEIDAVNVGVQKGIGGPPGMCLLTFSPRAKDKIFEKKHKPCYYLDIRSISRFWRCCGEPFRFHYTYSSNMLAAIRECLAQICEEGLSEAWTRHRKASELFCEKLNGLGLTLFVKDPKVRFSAVISINKPDDIDYYAFIEHLHKKYGFSISPGLGPTLNKAFRVGFLGHNARPEMADLMAEALKNALQDFRDNKSIKNNL